MPNETQHAVNWALQQQYELEPGYVVNVSEAHQEMPFVLVDKVRQYFNTNKITYSSFSYDDLLPYL